MIQEVANNGLSALKINRLTNDKHLIELLYLPATEDTEYDYELLLLIIDKRIILMLSGQDTYENFLYYLSLEDINSFNISPEQYIRESVYNFYRYREDSPRKDSLDYCIEGTENLIKVYSLKEDKIWLYTGTDSMSRLLYILSFETMDQQLLDDLDFKLC